MKKTDVTKRFLKNQIPMLILIVLAVVGLALIPTQIPLSKSAQGSVLGPQFFPKVMLWAVVGFSILSIVLDAYSAFVLKIAPNSASEGDVKGFVRVAVLFVALVLWYVLLKSVGFVIMTILLMALTMWLLGNRTWWQLVAVPVVFSLLIFMVFAHGLNVPLPAGLLAF